MKTNTFLHNDFDRFDLDHAVFKITIYANNSIVLKNNLNTVTDIHDIVNSLNPGYDSNTS